MQIRGCNSRQQIFKRIDSGPFGFDHDPTALFLDVDSLVVAQLRGLHKRSRDPHRRAISPFPDQYFHVTTPRIYWGRIPDAHNCKV
jgi:hypothetical protein